MAERRSLISGNWKMNINHLEAIQVVQKLAYRLRPADTDAVDVSLHPPFTSIRSVQTVIDADEMPLLLGAQNCHQETAGAFTGEVSPTMLAKLGVKLVIVGHSERRHLFGEDDGTVNLKARAVLAAGMTPIVCVGETIDQREAGETDAVVSAQITGSLSGLSPAQVGGLVVAYEPVWAIGTGRTATPDDAQQVCAAIRAQVASSWSAEAARNLRVQYGGSVKPDNAAEILSRPDIDGALVGGASLDPDQFAAIVTAAV
ncbi:MAG TPA: triose-phosphate isomerase [Acidimicrobiales bacterium]|nr:triose-phosphate isomerase [Acidimicrobiales bacterium]